MYIEQLIYLIIFLTLLIHFCGSTVLVLLTHFPSLALASFLTIFLESRTKRQEVFPCKANGFTMLYGVEYSRDFNKLLSVGIHRKEVRNLT